MKRDMMMNQVRLFMLLWLGCVATWCVGEPRQVRMNSGDVFIGEVIEQADDHVVLEHPLLGQVKLPREQIASIADQAAGEAEAEAQPKPQPEPEPKAKPEPEPAPKPEPKAESAVEEKPERKGYIDKLLEEWNFRLRLGMSNRDSNRQTTDINAKLTAKYKDDRDRWDISAQYFMQRRDDDKSRNDVHLAVRKDWLFPDSPWFLFGQLEWDHDEFKSWDHRVSTHGGLGYDLKDFFGLEAELRAGGGVTREFGGVDPKVRPESLFSSALTWKPDPKHTLSGSVEIFPSVDDEDEYRIRTQADWTYKFTDNVGLSIGYWNEYDSAVPSGFEKNDTRVFGSVVFDF